MDRNIKENSFKNTTLSRGRNPQKKPNNKLLIIIISICAGVIVIGASIFVMSRFMVHNKASTSSESTTISTAELKNETASFTGESKLAGQSDSNISQASVQNKTTSTPVEVDENKIAENEENVQSKSSENGDVSSVVSSTASSYDEKAQSSSAVTDSNATQSMTTTSSPADLVSSHPESESTSSIVSTESSSESGEVKNPEKTTESDFVKEILEDNGVDGDYLFVKQDTDRQNETLAKQREKEPFTTGGLERLFVISYVYDIFNTTDEQIYGAQDDLRDYLLAYLERNYDESIDNENDEYSSEIIARLGGYNPSTNDNQKHYEMDKEKAYNEGVKRLSEFVDNYNQSGVSFTEPGYLVEGESDANNQMTLGWCKDYFKNLLGEENDKQYSLFTTDAEEDEIVPILVKRLKKKYKDPNVAWCAWEPETEEGFQLVLQIKAPNDHIYFFGIVTDSDLSDECQNELAESLIHNINEQDIESGE